MPLIDASVDPVLSNAWYSMPRYARYNNDARRITPFEWCIALAFGVTIAAIAFANHQRRRSEQSTAKNAAPPAEIPDLIAQSNQLAASQKAAVEFRETVIRQSHHGEPPNGKPPNLTIGWEQRAPRPTPQIPMRVEIDYPNNPMRQLTGTDFKDYRIRLVSPASDFQDYVQSVTPEVARKLIKDLTSAVDEIEMIEVLEKIKKKEASVKK